ncbi:conjugal transfer protein TraN [Neiella marina]|uniref:Conjugal transfer protein TraN n=1 Tax=Neiella holothuriorum TaxID=2870530 RepID=A0ABS7EI20_9GAMM|nr:conjugal transfer protein TraN [Neiella holothuriorum]MBW8191287.1 conjugal transfer protein TraN [Neiella holothuriorum]
MKKTSTWYRATSVVTSITLLVQGLHFAFFGVLIGIVMPSPFEAAYAAVTQEQLKEKYDTDNPYNNYTGTAKRDEVLNKSYPSGSTNYELMIIDKYHSAPTPSSTPFDYSKYDNGQSFDTKWNNAVGSAMNDSATAQIPQKGAGDNVQVNYHTEGALVVERNSDGSLSFTPNTAVSDTVLDLEFNEATGAELDHLDTSLEADGEYGDEDGFNEVAIDQLEYLKGGTTSDSLVYKTLLDSYNDNPAPTLNSGSHLFTYGDNELSNAKNGVGDWYQSCTETTTETEQEVHYPVWEERRCQEPNQENLNSCTIERTSDYPIRVVDTGGNLTLFDVEYVDDYTVKVKVGKDDGNFLGDATEDGGPNKACKVYSSAITFEIDPTYNIVKAERSHVRIDDSLAIFVNGSRQMHQEPHSTDDSNYYWSLIPDSALALPRARYNNVPMDWKLWNTHIGTGDYIKCEHHSSNDKDTVDITNLVKPLRDGRYLELEYLLGVAGSGEVFYEVTLEFDSPLQAVDTVIQTPEGCADAIGWSINDNPKICTDGNPLCEKPYKSDNSFCYAEDWECVDESSAGLDDSFLDAIAPFYPGDDHRACWKANAVNYTCDPFYGEQYCATYNDSESETKDEVEVCYTYDEMRDLPDSCAVEKADPNCYEKERTCSDGWFDDYTEQCYMWQITYECDIGVTKTKTNTQTTDICTGALPCIGGDCEAGTQEDNTDFAQAAAHFDQLSMMGDDMNCADPSDPDSCTVFNGEHKFCSWEVSGLGADCCEKPEDINVFEYIKLAKDMKDVAAYMDIPYAGQVDYYANGAWDTVQTGIQDGFQAAWDFMPEQVTSSVESLFGESSGSLVNDAMTSLGLDQLEQQMMTYAKDKVTEWFGTELSSQLFSTSAGAVTWGPLMTSVMSFISFVGMAYMIYQMVVLLLNLLTACEEEEQDMGVRIATHQCFKVGDKYCSMSVLGLCIQKRQDWCCYGSALSRIIMEQAAPMLGKDMSTCAGLTPSEMESLDWSQIDLSEWIALSEAADIMLEEDDFDEATLNERRTPNEGGRLTAGDEVQEYMDGGGWLEAKDQLQDGLDPNNVNCSVYPRPPVCDLNQDPTGG